MPSSLQQFNFSIRTSKREEFVEITDEIRGYLHKSNVRDGFCKVFVPHTTAGITINENADIDVERDLLKILRDLVPKGNYLHSEGNSDAHMKSSIIGSDVDVFIQDGNLMLGQWQGIFFCEFDGPRTRRIYLQIHES